MAVLAEPGGVYETYFENFVEKKLAAVLVVVHFERIVAALFEEYDDVC